MYEKMIVFSPKFYRFSNIFLHCKPPWIGKISYFAQITGAKVSSKKRIEEIQFSKFLDGTTSFKIDWIYIFVNVNAYLFE